MLKIVPLFPCTRFLNQSGTTTPTYSSYIKFDNVNGQNDPNTGRPRPCSSRLARMTNGGEHPVRLRFSTLAGGIACGSRLPTGKVELHGSVIHELLHALGRFKFIDPMLYYNQLTFCNSVKTSLNVFILCSFTFKGMHTRLHALIATHTLILTLIFMVCPLMIQVSVKHQLIANTSPRATTTLRWFSIPPMTIAL